MKYKILLGLIFGILLIGLASARFCYQESANVSNQSGTDGNCNLNYSGSYLASSSWGGAGPVSEAYDGNYFTASSGNPFGVLEINYTKPSLALNSSLWQVKPSKSVLIANNTILNSCWNFDSSKLVLKVEANFTSANISSYCYNSSGWQFLSNTTSITNFYEEGMYWNISAITENSQTYSSPVTKLTNNQFTINLTYDSIGFSTIKANLTYNNTQYIGSQSGSGNNILFSINVTAPSVSTITNKTFYWTIGLTNATSTYYFNSTFYNQTITFLGIDDCSTYTNKILNYTLWDEDLLTSINGSIEAQILLYDSTGSNLLVNYSTNKTNKHEVNFCLDNFESITTYALLSSQVKYYNTSYATEYSNKQYVPINSTYGLYNYSLYDLLSTSSTSFTINYQDNNFLPVSNAIVKIFRQYINLGTYLEVEAPLTDKFGVTTGHFVNQNVIYNVQVWKNGVLLSTYNNVNAICQNPTISTCLINLNAFNSGSGLSNPLEASNLDYTLTYSNSTKVLTFAYSTQDGTSQLVNFTVLNSNNYQNNTLCATYVTSSSGVLTCSIPTLYQNGTILAKIYTGNQLIITNEVYVGLSGYQIFGQGTYILAFFMYASLALLFASTPIGIVIGSILGIGMAIGLNLYSSGGIFSTTSTLLYFIIAGAVIIYRLAKEI